MIDITNDEIRDCIQEIVDNGVGSSLSEKEIRNALKLWNKGISLGEHNCSKRIIEDIGLMLDRLNRFKADNDYALNSITWSFRDGENIRYRVAKEETMEYDLDDVITMFLEKLLTKYMDGEEIGDENSNNGRES